jgi:uncharacterized RDD family membrane protein YckC/predicted Ser/Thr protein kinase
MSLFGKKKKGTDSTIGSRQTEGIEINPEYSERAVETDDLQIEEIEEAPVPAVPDRLNHFEIVSEIGKGGMGMVYLARDVSLDREVALKLLSPLLTREQQMVDRFVREARAQARISHPNITQIYFIGQEGECHFFAMELVHGKTLAEALEDRGAMPWEEALGYIRQAAKGLAAAHERGVVHHDVKPSNMILTEDGLVKIADFGLAKRIERDSRITGTGVITGTPAYMSPEQGRGNETDHRSDIYSLGASLFHLIAGRPPFMGDSPVGTIVQQITQPPPKLIDVVPGIPRRLSDLAARCLEKDPARRYQSYDELLQAIDEAIPRKITPAGAYARLSALLFDLVLVALVLILPWPGDMARVVFYAAYFILLESLLGFTPGKKVLKLAIRKMDGRRALPARIGLRFILAHWFVFAAIGIMLLLVGEKPQDWRAFLQEKQAIAMLLAVLALLYVLGLVSTIFSRQKQALHDSLSGTIVMYDIP